MSGFERPLSTCRCCALAFPHPGRWAPAGVGDLSTEAQAGCPGLPRETLLGTRLSEQPGGQLLLHSDKGGGYMAPHCPGGDRGGRPPCSPGGSAQGPCLQGQTMTSWHDRCSGVPRGTFGVGGYPIPRDLELALGRWEEGWLRDRPGPKHPLIVPSAPMPSGQPAAAMGQPWAIAVVAAGGERLVRSARGLLGLPATSSQAPQQHRQVLTAQTEA